jgi:hypothetical protein
LKNNGKTGGAIRRFFHTGSENPERKFIAPEGSQQCRMIFPTTRSNVRG